MNRELLRDIYEAFIRLDRHADYPNLVLHMQMELDKPEQEPVGEVVDWPDDFNQKGVAWEGGIPPVGTKLYAAPSHPIAEQDKDVEQLDLVINAAHRAIDYVGSANYDHRIKEAHGMVDIAAQQGKETRGMELTRPQTLAISWKGADESIGTFPVYTTPQPTIPEGWKLVPIDPTEEMMDAAEICSDDWPRTTWKKAWKSMLEVAPSTLAEQIRQAKDEMSKWPESRKVGVQLQGPSIKETKE